jgi:F-type H+-transporting ATPase subunit gamma
MATLRDLKGRIGSVGSSEKITGAMKMISSAKMNKAVRDIRSLLPFRTQLETIIGNLLAADAEFSSPLTEAREVRHITVVVLGSDDGLCGAYNVNIFKQLLGHLEQLRSTFGAAVRIEVVAVGVKMARAVAKLTAADSNVAVVEAPEGVNSKSSGEQVKQFVEYLRELFLGGATDRIDVVYMNFISPSRQRLNAQQLLPVLADNFRSADQDAATSARPYIFEPGPAAIFSTVLPLMLLSTVQEVFCENRASEQAARVMAMQSANDNAKKLLEQLQLEYNKLRQQSITNELLDILGGQVK